MGTNLIVLQPGINIEATPSLNQAAFQASNQIRFAPSGLVEKLGGWSKFYSATIGSIVRALHPWEGLDGVSRLGVGAVSLLGVIQNSILKNITPQTATDNPAVSFSTSIGSPIVSITDAGSEATIYDVVNITTQISVGGIVLFGPYPVVQNLSANSFQINASQGHGTGATTATANVTNGGATAEFSVNSGSPIVQVTLNNHGLSVGSTFPVLVSTTVGGLTFFGLYAVYSVIDANNFQFIAPNQAASTTTGFMNGGNAQLQFWITIGPPQLASGFGDGGFGLGGFGTGQAITGRTGTAITTNSYTLDNFGGWLLACPIGSPIFVWNPQSGFFNAQMVSQGPSINQGIFVAMPAQIVMAYGAETNGIQDPLLLKWCDAGALTTWIPSTTNQAGSYRFPRGSMLIGGLQGPQYAVIWTDIEVWSVSYIGQPLIWSFNSLGSGCGLISQFACCVLSDTVYWMSQKQFFMIPSGGGVTPLPCSVWDFIFQNIDQNNLAKIRACPNSQFGEVRFDFPVKGGSGENTAYVKYTPAFNCWDCGFNTTINVGRSAWTDQSIFGPPIGADPVSTYVYQHETSPDADGQPMTPSFTTGFWALAGGDEIMTNDLVEPDFKWAPYGQGANATLKITFTYTSYLQNPNQYNTLTYSVQSDNPSFFRPMVRGRYMSMTVAGSDIGSWWRMGGPRIRTGYDGRL